MAQMPASASKLTLKSDLTEDDFASVKSAFENPEYWNEKNIIGNSDPNAERSQCIRIVHYNRRFRGFRPYQAVWWITKGPFDSDKWEISHACTCEHSGGYSSCINIHHMRLEPKKMNLNERRPHQKDLRIYSQKTKFNWPQEPMFLTTIGKAANCKHKDNGRKDDDEDDEGYPEYPCFMNLRKINKKGSILGQHWYVEPKWTGPKIYPKAADDAK